MNQQPHILTITDTVATERQYSIDCPGVTDDCRTWRRCEQCGPEQLDELLNNRVLHGVKHISDEDGDLFVPTGECWMSGNGNPEAAADRLGVGVGRHEVPMDVFVAAEL